MNEITDLGDLRKSLKITQADVAVVVGVSRLTYLKWENNMGLMPIAKYQQAFNFLMEKQRLNPKEQL